MNRLDEEISRVAYILDSLIALRNIQGTGSCNDCAMSRVVCACRAKPGQTVRYNCPFFARHKGGES